MGGQRYSRILSAARYYAAVDNYIKYITDSAKQGINVGKGTARPKSQTLYIRPFGVSLLDKQLAVVKSAEPTWTKYKAQVTGYTTATTPTTAGGAVDIEDYLPSRLNIKTGIGSTGVVKTSKVTGMKYLSYGGKSTSLAFGDKIADPGKSSETATFESLKVEVEKALVGGTGGSRVTWIREKV
ncbi:hypothetical protein [Okeania sp. SIO2B3]|uniref:hypothetical protein n=1 Tax=Okeania sp. SIO2B3 TaxID=2607784 RepID=UPI0013C0B384|nr:hypothetical protein [Okeania sp. SIO2B3]NET46199.1 hypothetical protein [Okeania sp. SIO2B3]